MSRKTKNISRRNWSFLIPQLAIILLTALLFREFNVPRFWLLSLAIYLLLSSYLKVVIPKFHRKGLFYLRKGEVEGAIFAFEKSYAFFSQYDWIDRYRAFTLFSLSAFTYKEMALMNIIYCHTQLKNTKKAKEIQNRLAKEYPNNPYSK